VINSMYYWQKLPFIPWFFIRRLSHMRRRLLSSCFQKNNNNYSKSILAVSFSILLSPTITAAQVNTTNYETEFGQSLEKGLLSGQPLWLDDAKAKFFAIYDPDQTGQPKGGVIILHDASSNPDKPEVIRPLRNILPLHGWASISIQLPYLASIDDYTNQQALINQRINSAANYLQTVGIGNIAILGHGTGAMAATAYLSSQQDASIQAFIAISLGMINKDKKPESITQQIEKITVPILDIYGSNDLPHVTNTAMSRALAAKISSDAVTNSQKIGSYKRSAIAKSSTQNSQGYISYRQIIIEGANHDFSGAAQQLTKRIAGWLERHAKGVTVNASR